MNSKSLGAAKVLAWPTAVVDVMSAQAAVTITRRRDIANVPEDGRDEAIAAFAAEHSELTGGSNGQLTPALSMRSSTLQRPSFTRSARCECVNRPFSTENIPL